MPLYETGGKDSWESLSGKEAGGRTFTYFFTLVWGDRVRYACDRTGAQQDEEPAHECALSHQCRVGQDRITGANRMFNLRCVSVRAKRAFKLVAKLSLHLLYLKAVFTRYNVHEGFSTTECM